MPDTASTIAKNLELATHAYQRSDFAEAKRLCSEILLSEPANLHAMTLLGAIYARINQPEQAIPLVEKVAAAHPHQADALNNLGYMYLMAGRFPDAQKALTRAIELNGNYAAAQANLGLLLLRQKRWNEAYQYLNRAIALDAHNVEAFNNRGTVLMNLGRYAEALADYDHALALRPNYADAHLNRGVLFTAQNLLHEAQLAYQSVLAVSANDPTALWALGQILILQGQIPSGWKLYEHRWRSPKFTDRPRAFPAPLWMGDTEISGQSILLHAEQGLGDTIQFCRYIPQLVERGAKVILLAQRELRELLSNSSLGAAVITPDDRLPYFDLHCPLMSLPCALGTTLQTIPSDVPYLNASQTKIADFKRSLGPALRRRIGLAWAGRSTHVNDSRRSIGSERLLPLLNKNFEFHSLGIDSVPEPLSGKVFSHADRLKSFADTAALVSCMDLVISVDTSVAHLAGALGLPVWIMLPFAPDFRWMLNRPDSPWYPSARLFRQAKINDWSNVIGEILAELQTFQAPQV